MNNEIIKDKKNKYHRRYLFGFKFFRFGYRDGAELNIRFWKYTLRIARHQFAFWVKYDPVFNLLF